MQHTLAIDIETYSSVDLAKSGVYKYVESPDFTVLMLSYSFNGGEVVTVDFSATHLSYMVGVFDLLNDDFLEILQSPTLIKTAWNANFERTCLSKFFGIELPPEQWECTMVKAAMLGLPLSLDACSKVLKLDEKKDSAGKALIRYFSMPCEATKTNGGRTRNLPEHDADKWSAYLSYNAQDVRTELAIRERISFFNIPAKEKLLWNLDQRMNDRGVLLDRHLIENAISIDAINKERLMKEAIELTGLPNPNSVSQLKEWLTDDTTTEPIRLTKEGIPLLLLNTKNPVITRILTIRQELSKTSVKKYTAMLNGVCADGRLRGLLQFYGANRTGRWAGRLVQVQNLPRNEMSDLDLARECVLDNDVEMIEILFGNVPDTLSQLIRTAFIAPDGYTFVPSDFSAIEARVIAWLAGEKWRLDVFNTHGKIYEASASQMFKVPIAEISKGSPLRQKGKVSELALGYQGGPNALITMGALSMGVLEEELPKLVKMWRNANPAIVKLWYAVNDAAIEAVQYNSVVPFKFGMQFYVKHDILFIKLPSGRELAYQSPRSKDGQFGLCLTYEGMDHTTKQWKRQDTYGGKLVENIVQAIARDCLAEKMLALDANDYSIAMHIHDEAVIEHSENAVDLDAINKIMSEPISWAKGLPLNADSYTTKYYKKD